MSKQIARRYFVRGRVQGVGFRYFAQKAAAEQGLQGYTANHDDGRVEVYAIGTADELDELAGRLRTGPRMADVRGVDVEEAGLEKVSGFQIRH